MDSKGYVEALTKAGSWQKALDEFRVLYGIFKTDDGLVKRALEGVTNESMRASTEQFFDNAQKMSLSVPVLLYWGLRAPHPASAACLELMVDTMRLKRQLFTSPEYAPLVAFAREARGVTAI